MAQTPVNLNPGGLPETVLSPAPADASAELGVALGYDGAERAEALASVAARWPTMLEAWAMLGATAEDRLTDHPPSLVEAYAYYRVGYHRGLDALRAAGWRGSGYVRWEHELNRGFLACLMGLQRCAEAIGEMSEAQRCAQFHAQLDPDSDIVRPQPGGDPGRPQSGGGASD